MFSAKYTRYRRFPMIRSTIRKSLPVSALLFVSLCLLPGAGRADVCSEGIAEPPFLAYGVDPNLLIIIDNSASMYDLAYVPKVASQQGYCYDDTFVASDEDTDADGVLDAGEDTNGNGVLDNGNYGGYFDASPGWYKYNPGTGQFEEITEADALTACDTKVTAGHTKYYKQSAAGVSVLYVTIDETVNPHEITSFAATEDFLNWAASSKFDVEKKVLTGGKFYENGGTKRLVLESRGCMTKKFVKQTKVVDSSSVTKYLTLAVRPPSDTEQTTDSGDGIPSSNMSRIEIYAVTTNGFQATKCQAAIDAFVSGNLGTLKTETVACLDPMSTGLMASHTAFNHIFQECWYYNKHGVWQNTTSVINQMETDCQKVYNVTSGNPPSAPLPNETTYLANYAPDILHPLDVCYGVWGTTEGYVGRCWESTYTTGGVTCAAKECDPDIDTPAETLVNPDTDTHSADEFCDTVSEKWYYCDGNYNASQDKCLGNPGTWAIKEECTAGAGATLTSLDWTDDAPGLFFTDLDDCIVQAARKYCLNIEDSEVVDPSDSMGSQGSTYNVPAILIESALDSQLGDPLLAMRGRIVISSTPSGLLQNYENDLLMGAMAFNPGPKTECAPIEQPAGSGRYVANLYNCLTDKGTAITATSTTDTSQRDGARIINYIGKGSDHMDMLIDSINTLTAYSWTPTAEAFYEAIGYYTQDTSKRINHISNNDTDFLTDSDFVLADHPNWVAGNAYTAGDIVNDSLNGNKLYITFESGNASLLQMDGATAATEPSHDTNLSWFPIDPVTAWCQKNNILILTDGASTADQQGKEAGVTGMTDFAITNDEGDNDTTAATYSCVDGNGYGLHGSTLLDDLTSYAFNSLSYPSNEFTNEVTGDSLSGDIIRTYLVATGTLRGTVAGLPAECDSKTLLTHAAEQANDPGKEYTKLYEAEDPDQLETALIKIFDTIRSGTASGSAASVISSSRGGEGAIYQAIFWPSVDVTGSDPVEWTGEVHALHIDSSGYLYEDTVGDRVLNTDEDNRVIIYFDSTAGKSKACCAPLVNGACPTGSSKDVDEVQYLWSANDWLAKVGSVNDIFHNRATYISNERKRYIFTWVDLNNNGIVDSNEVLPFEDRDDTDTATNWENMDVSTGNHRGAAHKDFNAADNAEVNKIVRWVRGYDDTGQRSRELQIDLDKDGNKDDTITWRLGDVIHSTPMVVTRPSEGYDLLYRDISYAAFVSQYKNRRHVVYFGSNDGMIHAVNGGFYSNSGKKFCLTFDCDESDLGAVPELGAELWAYVPTNLLPHLKCLTEPEYSHKYFVDQRPRIFDVRIFPEDDYSGVGNKSACGTAGGAWDEENAECLSDHPGGWGTILVGGMRLGGAKVLAADLNSDAGDTREFTSAYFILDISNPEKPPTLLGELTRTTDGNEVDLGYTTVIPTMVVMNKGDEADDGNIDADDGHYYKWYLVLGNGPRGVYGLDGESDQKPRVSILPLSWLIDPDPADAKDPRTAFRLPGDLPSSGGDWPEGGTFVLNDSGNGFVSDPITVDFYLKPDYMSDVVYFGTIEGSTANWSGKMYRLVTRYEDNNTQVVTTPSQWYGIIDPDFVYGVDFAGDADPANPVALIDAGRPITASATVGTDGDNFWVYFGTGRFFNSDDKSDISQQTYYGIKEPMDCNDDFTWDTVENTDTGSDATVHNGTPGNQGLLRVDQILVKNTPTISTATLSCIDVTDACLPGGVTVLSDLVTYIAGSGCSYADSTGTDGWYKKFLLDRERNLGQATLLGGLATFTTYQPYDDPCQSEGLAFLYGVYYLTGTAWHKSIFGDEGLDTSDEENVLVLDVLALGRGLATTPNLFVGKGEGGPKAFVQTSTGEIKEIPQTNLPIQNYKSGRTSWRELIP